jgi:hypothetical protein
MIRGVQKLALSGLVRLTTSAQLVGMVNKYAAR